MSLQGSESLPIQEVVVTKVHEELGGSGVGSSSGECHQPASVRLLALRIVLKRKTMGGRSETIQMAF